MIKAGSGLAGKRLELLAAYLFGTLDSFRVVWRTRGRGGEYDLLVENAQPLGRPFRWMRDYVLVECKDTDRTVSSKEFGHFLAKLQFTRTDLGVILSRRGLSGRRRGTDAEASRNEAFSQFGITVLDILVDELSNLANLDQFLQFLRQKYEDLRFRGSRKSPIST